MEVNFLPHFKLELLLVKICGVWDYLYKTKYEYVYWLYFVVVNIYLSIYNLMKFDDMLHATTLEEIVAAGFVLPIALMGNIRSFCFFAYRKEFFELLTTMDDEVFQPTDQVQVAMAKKMLKVYSVFKVVMYWGSIVPSFGCVIGRILTGKPQEHCESVINSSKGIEMYIFQAIALGMISVVNVVTNYFMAGFALFVGLQCDQLCYQLINMELVENVSIKKFVLHHRRILRFAGNLEKLFSIIYFTFIIMCLLAFCMTLFMISVTDKFSYQIFHLVFYQFSIFVMLLIPCWFSTQLTIKSEKIPFAAYSSPWTGASKSFKNELMIFLLNSQEPIQLKAMDIVDLSLETYMAIVKSSFSYYTVLNNLIFGE
ncbi:odorant receptor 13a-like [Diabrotica undecimpunctata]|uniref:odorant receptor 13a-like n=1 Tax=Diabrotica undecimpunctata TaxID=50387 RepID=UPI003B6408D1